MDIQLTFIVTLLLILLLISRIVVIRNMSDPTAAEKDQNGVNVTKNERKCIRIGTTFRKQLQQLSSCHSQESFYL